MAAPARGLIGRLKVAPEVTTAVVYDDAAFYVNAHREAVRVAIDQDRWVMLRHRTQTLTTGASVHDSDLLVEERSGTIDYERYLMVDWEDGMSLPFLSFVTPPLELVRQYSKGQSIELGLEDVACYTVSYRDGVQARFERTGPATFNFEFSTGFEGSFWRDGDGWCNLRFRGDVLEMERDGGRAQSKFVVSRCKYSDNLLLVFQDDATVHLS